MQNNFFCNYPYINIFENPSNKSKISSQIIYGEKFKVLKKVKNFLKIRTSYDKYHGYIKNKKFKKKIKATHKVKVLKTRVLKSNKFLPFSSEVEILKKRKNYVMFENNKWIKAKNIYPINQKNKNIFKLLKIFLNCKYKWGGKTYDGIDCSALIQLFYKFNNKFFPRDTVDQVKFRKGINIKKFKLGDIIYWKGHVAICINSNKLIHAYGPKKKVLVMDIYKAIKLIKKTANLEVKKIFRI